MFDLIIAANFLDVKGLLYSGCKTVSNMIEDCNSSEDISNTFGINNDFDLDLDEIY